MAKSESPNDNVLKYIKSNGIKFVDLKFMDFPGQWQHFTVPVTQFDEGSFEDGFGFDGSSIRGWKPINESDMLIIPDPKTMFVDPFIEQPTISLICDVYEPATKEKYTRCPRNIAQKAEAYLISTGIADTVYYDPKQNFSSLMMSDLILSRTANSILWIQLKADGTVEKMKLQILVTNHDSRKDIFLFLQRML